jgi:hypothetical protein
VNVATCTTQRVPLTALLCCALALPAIRAARAVEEEPTVTPYRPTVSNPADLPQPGWVEGELGGSHTFGEDGSRSESVPWLVKYAFDENHGILVGGNAFVRSAPVGAPAASGFGDLILEWKQRFPIVENGAFGIEAGAIVPSAPHDLGVGEPAFVVNAIYSTGLGALHLDLNAGGTRYSAQANGLSRWQSAWAAAGSWPLSRDFGAALELSGTQQRGVPMRSQVLGAINYNSSAHLVFDAGLAYGLTHAAHDRSVFAGATLLLGKLK